jgi:hypothetical protein
MTVPQRHLPVTESSVISRLIQGEAYDHVLQATMSKVPSNNDAGTDHPRPVGL